MTEIIKEAKNNDIFLSSVNRDYTYRDLHIFARYFKGILQQYDIGKEKPVALCASSSDELIFIIAVCWLQGIPFASLNPESKGSSLRDHITRLEAPLIITDSTSTPIHRHSIDIDTLNLEELLDNDYKSNSQPLDGAPGSQEIMDENVFGYFFTSGTSGDPKIVPLKRRQMVSAARNSAQNLRLATDELWLLCLPLYHIGGISVILRSILYGSGIYRMDGFDAKRTGQLLSAKQQIVAVSLVSTMLKRLMELDTFIPHPKLKGILLGGGPIPPDLLVKCLDRNIPVIPSYGMTETCAQIAANPIFSVPENPETLRSTGSIFPPNQIEIRDEDGEQAKKNSSGSVWLKGPQIFDGYLDNSDTMFDTNGWFDAGDFGRIDDRGRLFIEARRTDLIISGGENVSPFEVEQALKAMHGIRDAAVTGLPDEEWGQKVVAAVVFEENKSQSVSELKKILKGTIDEFKVPKEIIAVGYLPRTETGKIKRSKLHAFF